MSFNAAATMESATATHGTLMQVDRAMADLRRGGFVGLREGGAAWLAVAAEAAEAATLVRLGRLAGRPPVLALTATRLRALGLSPGADSPTMSISLPAGRPDAAAALIAALIDPTTSARRFADAEGTALAKADPGAASAVELCKLARLLPAAVVAPVQPLEDGTALPAQIDGLDLLAVETAAVMAYETAAARSLKPLEEARLPLQVAEDARVVAFRPSDGGYEHLAIIIGTPETQAPVLVRIHSQCITGDLLGSLRCDCGPQLHAALQAIAEAGSGVLIYLAQEGRGIGLVNKLRAYNLQDDGLDTFDANERIGFAADERLYQPAAEMLRHLGISTVRLMTNNPDKGAGLERHGITVAAQIPLRIEAGDHNAAYLAAKARHGHHL